MTDTETRPRFEEWCILELLGHRRLAGRVSEQVLAGSGFLRIDVPGKGDTPAVTQFVSPGSIYVLTPVTEAIARAVAANNQPAPVSHYDIPGLRALPSRERDDEYIQRDDEDEFGL